MRWGLVEHRRRTTVLRAPQQNMDNACRQSGAPGPVSSRETRPARALPRHLLLGTARAAYIEGPDVVAASRSDHSARAFELGASAYVSLSDPAALFAQQLDVLLISVSIVSFERTLAALTPYMEGRDVLVVDVLSVKDFPKKLFEERVPASCDILATHPMFGPESGGGPNGWRGLNFVCVNAAADSPNNETETFVSPPVSPCLSRCAGTTRCASPTAPRRATGSSASSRCGRSKAAAWWR